MEISRRRKSVYNALTGVLQQTVTLVLGLIVPHLFIAAYGSAVNGLQSSITNIYTYIALLEAGVGTAALQALYAPILNGDQQRVNAVYAATHRQYRRIALAYLGCVVVFAGVFPATVEIDLPYLEISGMVALSGVSSFLSFWSYGKLLIVLQADGRNFAASMVGIVGYVLQSLLKIVLIQAGMPLLWIYTATAGVAVLTALFWQLYRRKVYPWLDVGAAPDTRALRQSRNVLVHHISGIICASTDVLVLTYVARDLALVSVYNVYNMVFEAVRSLLLNVFGAVDFILGQAWNGDRKRFDSLYPLYETAYITATFILYTTAYALVRPFMQLYTAAFTDADYLLIWLPLLFTLVKLLFIARNPAIQLITWAGHFKQTQWRSVLETCINLTVSIVCVLRWGIYGVLMGTIAAMTYRTVDAYLYISRHLLHDSPWRHFKPLLICWSGFALIALGLRRLTLRPASYGQFFLLAVPVTAGIALSYLLWQLLWNRKQTVQLLRRVLRRKA